MNGYTLTRNGKQVGSGEVRGDGALRPPAECEAGDVLTFEGVTGGPHVLRRKTTVDSLVVPNPAGRVIVRLDDLAEFKAIRWDDVIGAAEIRELAGGVSRATFKRWRDADFPAPHKTLTIGDLYDRKEVEEWLYRHRMRKIDA